MDFVIGVLVLGAVASGFKAHDLAWAARRAALLDVEFGQSRTRASRAGVPFSRLLTPLRANSTRISAAGLGLLGGVVGIHLAGPVGCVALGGGATVMPFVLRRRSTARRNQKLEQQLSTLVEATALAVRTGLSIPQALEFAADEAEEPMAAFVERIFAAQRLGTPFETALQEFGAAVGTDDARLFVLVVGIHARSGGDLAGALNEVAATVRHRVAVRRELRALSAQGRLSGGVLGSLPLLFFLVLAATSRRELQPVYRSAAGITMIGGGLSMQGLAYLWIRRLLHVEV